MLFSSPTLRLSISVFKMSFSPLRWNYAGFCTIYLRMRFQELILPLKWFKEFGYFSKRSQCEMWWCLLLMERFYRWRHCILNSFIVFAKNYILFKRQWTIFIWYKRLKYKLVYQDRLFFFFILQGERETCIVWYNNCLTMQHYSNLNNLLSFTFDLLLTLENLSTFLNGYQKMPSGLMWQDTIFTYIKTFK